MPTGYSNLTGKNPFKGKKRKPFTLRHKKKMSKAMRGRVAWNKGTKGLTKHSDKTKLKMSKARKGKKHWNWKGSKVKYSGIHTWVLKNWGPAKLFNCKFCKGKSGSKVLNWANINHKYTRKKKDWMILCVSCHRKYDYLLK